MDLTLEMSKRLDLKFKEPDSLILNKQFSRLVGCLCFASSGFPYYDYSLLECAWFGVVE